MITTVCTYNHFPTRLLARVTLLALQSRIRRHVKSRPGREEHHERVHKCAGQSSQWYVRNGEIRWKEPDLILQQRAMIRGVPRGLR